MCCVALLHGPFYIMNVYYIRYTEPVAHNMSPVGSLPLAQNTQHCTSIISHLHLFSTMYVYNTIGGVSVTNPSSDTTSLTLSWTLDDGLEATTYTISYSNTDTDCFTKSDNITTSQSVYNLTDLEEGTEYSITVTALLSGGGSAQDSLTATTMAAG